MCRKLAVSIYEVKQASPPYGANMWANEEVYVVAMVFVYVGA